MGDDKIIQMLSNQITELQTQVFMLDVHLKTTRMATTSVLKDINPELIERFKRYYQQSFDKTLRNDFANNPDLSELLRADIDRLFD